MRRGREEPLLVAIDGRSGSGKSTLASALQTLTGATLLSGDDFYAGGCEVKSRLSPAQLADACLDRRRLRSALTQLKSGELARFRPFDWHTFDGRQSDVETVIESRPVVIIEGVYAYHPDLRDLIDLSILVECPEETRMERLIAREGAISDWEKQWQQAEDWYFSNLSPSEVFDRTIVNA